MSASDPVWTARHERLFGEIMNLCGDELPEICGIALVSALDGYEGVTEQEIIRAAIYGHATVAGAMAAGLIPHRPVKSIYAGATASPWEEVAL